MVIVGDVTIDGDKAIMPLRVYHELQYRLAALEEGKQTITFKIDPKQAIQMVASLQDIATRQAQPATEQIKQAELLDARIKHLADRFLGWKFPADFAPDGGVSFTRPNYGPEVDGRPTGTNLLSATQAEAMVRYMLEGMPGN